MLAKRPVLFIAFILMSAHLWVFAAQKGVAEMPGENFEQYSNQKFGVALMKPKDWVVNLDGGTISLKPLKKSATSILLYPIFNANKNMDAISFLRFLYDIAIQHYPDMNVESKHSNDQNTFAEVTATFTDSEKSTSMKGFYVVSLSEGRGIFCSYEASKADFDDNCQVMRKVLKYLQIQPVPFSSSKTASQDSSNLKNSLNDSPTIDINKLIIKAGSDNSMFVAVPSDWAVGGGNIALAATSPDESMGVTATNDHQPGMTRDPYDYFLNKLMPFFRCSQTEIQKREPNTELMNACKSQGIMSNSEDFIGETISGNGKKVKFWMNVNVCTTGNGMGFVSTIGFYAIPELFDRNAKVLYAITGSMAPNQGLIMGRLKENLGRIAQASRTMSETGDIVIQGLRTQSANIDRAFDKYNYYLSGEQAKYSSVENKIYVVDSNLGEYVSNPRYPQETLGEVPDHLWNQLVHERNY